MFKTSTLVAALALAVVASPAQAAGHSRKVGNDAYHVYFDDLNLATPEGRAAALARVDKASARLCEAEPVEVDRKACIAETGLKVTARWVALARVERGAQDRALAAR